MIKHIIIIVHIIVSTNSPIGTPYTKIYDINGSWYIILTGIATFSVGFAIKSDRGFKSWFRLKLQREWLVYIRLIEVPSGGE